MKRLLAVTVVLLLILQIPVLADTSDIKVMMDGKYLTFDQPPVMQNDRVLVPLRVIFEALNADVEWDDVNQTVKSTKGNTVVIMQIGNSVFTVNGTEKVLDVPPQLINSRTLVPVRAIAESFNCKVDWDNANQTVLIDSKVAISITTQNITQASGEAVTYNVEYPVISSKDQTVAADVINNSIKATIDKEIEDFKNAYIGSYDLEYAITNTENNLLSVLFTSVISYDDNTVVTRFAEIYKLDTGEKATLTDYFPNKSYEEIIAMFITDFNSVILGEPELYYSDAAGLVEIYIDSVVVYPCGNEIAVTFNPGVIAPYELGFKTLTYPAEY